MDSSGLWSLDERGVRGTRAAANKHKNSKPKSSRALRRLCVARYFSVCVECGIGPQASRLSASYAASEREKAPRGISFFGLPPLFASVPPPLLLFRGRGRCVLLRCGVPFSASHKSLACPSNVASEEARGRCADEGRSLVVRCSLSSTHSSREISRCEISPLSLPDISRVLASRLASSSGRPTSMVLFVPTARPPLATRPRASTSSPRRPSSPRPPTSSAAT